ncbi:hypothetical protein MATL_G00021720 [Megalops atlanticus]|uniref:2-oxo-4-hydroxy-4-carboxy-5-ureidoimidazoline decarboxylase n=1 Tax=Megalops atlanticus TaxID=7932 RepID=A0A9D3TFG7_MEGAT|nr:hypothetical protein MATL_G00021720 [Megalops atlanticus]
MDIETVNSLSYEEFIELFGGVVERCPLAAAAVWSRRPFGCVSDVEAGIGEFIDSLSESGKEGLVRCHPDLAGRELASGTLTAESQREQEGAGLASLQAEEAAQIAGLNREYKQRFGFPFVICARTSDKAAILQQLQQRLRNLRSQELLHAVQEIKKICHLRLQDLLHRAPPKL